jgi:hypothetical protein
MCVARFFERNEMKDSLWKYLFFAAAIGLMLLFIYGSSRTTRDERKQSPTPLAFEGEGLGKVSVFPFEFDGCQYIFIQKSESAYAGSWILHKGNCSNPQHIQNKR